MARTVLFVCAANTARSVMAQALAEHLLAARGATGVRVASAGVAPWARDGMLPSLDARIALREHGIDLDEHRLRSTALARHPELLRDADLVVTMTDAQKAIVASLGPPRGAVVTLRELAGERGDVGDPAGQGEERFRESCAEIRRCLERALDRLLNGFLAS